MEEGQKRQGKGESGGFENKGCGVSRPVLHGEGGKSKSLVPWPRMQLDRTSESM